MAGGKDFSEEKWEAELEERSEKAARLFKEFVKTVAQLRHPVRGCPWDLEQTHLSLRRYMIEEAYEAAEHMTGSAQSAELIEELGDVLLQVVLNSQLTVEAGSGDIIEVVRSIRDKMIRRHPHVFAPTEKPLKSADVVDQWAVIKQQEKPKATSVFAKARKVTPALTQAFEIGKQAHKIAFDWQKPTEVLDQFKSELAELEHEIHAQDEPKIAEELSDCFFSLAQLSRHLGYEPEDIAHRGNLKFLKRFDKVEALAKAEGLDVTTAGTAKLEELWLKAKQAMKQETK